MVAGPNGSGKTTLIESLRGSPEIKLPSLYVNADDLGRHESLDARAAQKLAASKRLHAIARRESFLYETVMSHPSKIAELQAAAAVGYTITVIFVATDSPDINIQRVALRVAAGGHDVPRDRIRARHRRSVALAPSAFSFATHAYIYDNTAWGTEATHQLQAVLVGTRFQAVLPAPATWVHQLIETTNVRAAELEDLAKSVRDQTTLALPNLAANVTEGIVAVADSYYALQVDQASGATLVHDQTLLPKPLVRRQNYRIEYADGVAKVTRRSGVRIRSVKSVSK